MIILIEETGEKLVSFCNKRKDDRMITLKNGIDKDELEKFLTKNCIDKRECIWVVTDRSQVKTAGEVHVAAAGQMDIGTQYAFESLKDVDAEYLDKIRMRYNGIPWIIGYTKRCMIRELSLSDIAALYDLYDKPGITDFVEPLYDLEKEIEYEKNYIKYVYGYFEYGMWLVFDRTDGRLIGRAGLDNREYDGKSELELGYIITPEYQGKGYATEICNFIIEYAWKNTDYDSISCFIESANIKSKRLAKKLGFTNSGSVIIGDNDMERWILVRNGANI